MNAAYLFENYSAVNSAPIEPLPHQIIAVYEKMLMRNPLRFVLADDPGAGKTIMAGLLIKELIVRGDVKRCLAVCPGALAEQWQDELRDKFQLNFRLMTDAENFSGAKLCIASIDKLVRNTDLQDKLCGERWDLIICDEAHKMSATISGGKIARTKRFRLGQRLGKITRHFLLMTATPHNGKDEDFHLFMSLIDPDRFEGVKRINRRVDVSDIMRRLVKEDLLTFAGKSLFPARRAYTVNYNLSPAEAELYRRVTAYVADGFNRAEKLRGDKKNSVGFAMTILQRRLASSPKAIYKSLERRTERLQEILRGKNFSDDKISFDAEIFDDDFPNAELERAEDELSERATAARNFCELQAEIQTLRSLTLTAKKILQSGVDKKWRELSDLLQDNEKISRGEKIIIFTEHRDTLDYLQEKISALFGRKDSVVTIHGGLNRRERRNVQNRFKSDENVRVLVATDAAGEGINLQNAHLMINYDLPWNPNRIEQRFGRIHRIGQKKICHLWNLVAGDTREGQVFRRLLEKLEDERVALGGKVFDILGKISFDDKPLRELLIEAIRHGDDPRIIRRLDSAVDKSFDDEKLSEILRERALTDDTLDDAKIADIRRKMTQEKIQPQVVEKFFVTAFKKLGGQIYKRGNGRFEITRVPAAVRDKALQFGFGEPVPKSYNRVCFAKENCAGDIPAELIAYGHPLLSAIIAVTLEKFGDVLKRGTIFIDDDAGKNFRVLFCVETKIIDERTQLLDKRLHFVEISADGRALPAKSYSDYRSPNHDERENILSADQTSPQIKCNADELVARHVAENILPAQIQAVAAHRKIFLDKTEREVKARLRSEIGYWDVQAAELRTKDKAKSERAAQIADELAERLDRRLADIASERKISAQEPVIVSRALIVPKAYVDALAEKNSPDAAARSRIEKIAMDAVTQIERELGNTPADVSGDNCGYDIESRAPDGKIRFVEVKGRNAAADTVTVTKNEILTALNSPENFILAIVRVDDNAARVVYVQSPFVNPPDCGTVSVNYKISSLLRQGNILLDRNILRGGD